MALSVLDKRTHSDSFREFLRHRGTEPTRRIRELTAGDRSLVEKEFREYLVAGGFPEAQGLSRESGGNWVLSGLGA